MTMINPTTNKPFTTADADSVLGLADAFMEDWEEHEGKGDPDCAERRLEWDALRPLLVQAPALVELRDAVKAHVHWENYPALVAAFDKLEKP